MMHLVEIFVVTPLPEDVMTLGYEPPNLILDTSSWSDGIKYLPPEPEMFIGRFLLREY
jgi:hypothetical protein